MSERLRAYWFEFVLGPDEDCPRGTRIGAGVTAFNANDAIELLRRRLFTHGVVPPIRLVVKNVDPGTLDPWHVRENMLPPTERGVWFPPIGKGARGFRLVTRARALVRALRSSPSRTAARTRPS